MYREKALEKINAGKKENFSDRKAAAINRPTADALCEFCKQSEEFAQAVCEGASYSECLKKIASGIGQAVSDIEVFSKAVEFYFPGAKIDCKMRIRMSEYEAAEAASDKIIDLDLASLL